MVVNSPAAELGLPSSVQQSSGALGWRTVRAVTYFDPPEVDAFETQSPDLLLVMVTAGRYRIESWQGRGWRPASYRPGSIGATAPGNGSVLRWRTTAAERMESLHLSLSPELMPEGRGFPDALSLRDPYVTASVRALGEALKERAPAVYADAVAQALVAHLAYRAVPGTRPSRPSRVAALSSTEVERVTAYMRAHLADDLSLADLAAQANVSKFHFLRLFSSATGHTPHRYLTKLRLEQAAELLRGTALSIQHIAVACGYLSPGQFAAAFRRIYGCTPTAYRSANS